MRLFADRAFRRRMFAYAPVSADPAHVATILKDFAASDDIVICLEYRTNVPPHMVYLVRRPVDLKEEWHVAGATRGTIRKSH